MIGEQESKKEEGGEKTFEDARSEHDIKWVCVV